MIIKHYILLRIFLILVCEGQKYQHTVYCALARDHIVTSQEDLEQLEECNVIAGNLQLEDFYFFVNSSRAERLRNLRDITGFLRYADVMSQPTGVAGFLFRNLRAIWGADRYHYSSVTSSKADEISTGAYIRGTNLAVEPDLDVTSASTCRSISVLGGKIITEDNVLLANQHGDAIAGAKQCTGAGESGALFACCTKEHTKQHIAKYTLVQYPRTGWLFRAAGWQSRTHID